MVIEELSQWILTYPYEFLHGEGRSLCFLRSSDSPSNAFDCFSAHRSQFLKTDYTKYVGWQLNDKNAKIRRLALETLAKLYERPNSKEDMALFNAKFKVCPLQ